jgi:hypothetical protein
MRWLGLFVGVALLSGCRLQLVVDAAVQRDSSGVIEVAAGLDADALERVGGDLAAVLVTDDLESAGWTVDGPARADDDITWVRLRRSFARAQDAASIFEEIAGPDGPFQDLRVVRHSSFAHTEWSFTGRLDFRGGLKAFGDAALAAELDGEPLGQTVEEIEAQLGEPLRQAIQVRVSVALPGDVTSNAPSRVGSRSSWQVGFGERSLVLEATGEERRTSSLVAVAVSAVCAGGLLVFGLVRLLSFARRRRAT